jgi:four helix bundle protein
MLILSSNIKSYYYVRLRKISRLPKQFNKEVRFFLRTSKTIDIVSKNQLRCASLSIVLNIAEGTSRFSKADKRNFYVISRGSAFECVAAFDCLLDEEIVSPEQFKEFYGKADELSRMLFKMIGNLSSN